MPNQLCLLQKKWRFCIPCHIERNTYINLQECRAWAAKQLILETGGQYSYIRTVIQVSEQGEFNVHVNWIVGQLDSLMCTLIDRKYQNLEKDVTLYCIRFYVNPKHKRTRKLICILSTYICIYVHISNIQLLKWLSDVFVLILGQGSCSSCCTYIKSYIFKVDVDSTIFRC